MPAPPLEATAPATARVDGRNRVLFGGCNYLGLAQDSRVAHAATQAIATYGLSTSASRETTGNAAEHAHLESELRDFTQSESALLVPDGYLANLVAMQALSSRGTRSAVLDERAHPSIRDAARLAGLTTTTYRHLDASDAARALAASDGPAVLATDAVFAADGAIAPAAQLCQALRPGDTLLLDDCHAFCVLGRQGRGTADHLDLPRPDLVVTTTLAKGLGCAGGVVLGSEALIATARRASTAYICTTPTAPALAAAARAALGLLQTDPALHDRLRANTTALARVLTQAGIPGQSDDTPIFAFTLPGPAAMRALHAQAWDEGLWLPLVEYPGGPAPLYFRLAVTAAHTQQHLDHLAAILARHTSHATTESHA